MKTNHLFAGLAVLFATGVAAHAGPPTAAEIKKDLCPAIIERECVGWRMAGFKTGSDVIDLHSTDLGPWGEPGRYKIKFRLGFVASEDVYGKNVVGTPDDDGPIVLVRIAQAGHRYFESFDFDVEKKTMERGTSWQFARSPNPGSIEWDDNVGFCAAGTRPFWESMASMTGEKLVFFDSKREAEAHVEQRTSR